MCIELIRMEGWKNKVISLYFTEGFVVREAHSVAGSVCRGELHDLPTLYGMVCTL